MIRPTHTRHYIKAFSPRLKSDSDTPSTLEGSSVLANHDMSHLYTLERHITNPSHHINI